MLSQIFNPLITTDSSYLLLILISLFQIKHFIADFIIQNEKIAANKGKKISYLLLHSLHHALLSFLIIILFFDFKIALFISLIEIATHSFFDFLKANKNLLGRYQFPSKYYFIFLGLDQLAHQLTYLLFIFLILKFLNN